MSEASHMKLIAGPRINSYLGLKMAEGTSYVYPGIQDRQYGYLEIPALEIYNPATDEILEKASRNQHVYIRPACTVDVKGSHRFEIHPNHDLWAYGVVQGSYYIESQSGEQVPGFYIALRKDLSISDIPWAIRIYMCS